MPSICSAAACMSGLATASPLSANSTMVGARLPKSRGRARPIQCTTACGSAPNRWYTKRRKSVQGIMPSWAHSTRRTASEPSQAPLPSSETGKPQPPTR